MSVNVVQGVPLTVPTSDLRALDVHARDAIAPAAAARRPGPGRPRRGPVGISCGSTRRSAVSARGPAPLARSMYRRRAAVGDGRGRRRPPARGVAAAFLFASTAEDEKLATDVVRQGNDDLRTYVADAPDRLLGLGSVRSAGRRRRGGAPGARRPRDGRHRHRQPRGGADLDDPVNDDLWACCPNAARSSSLHPSGVPDPAAEGLLAPQLVGYPMETALAVARLVFGRVLNASR